MNYKESMDFLSDMKKSGIKLGLQTVENLLERLGNPERDLKIIHIAGTNGKGSIASFISHILVCGGYRTGFFNSPYLERFNECIMIDNTPVSDETIAKSLSRIKEEIIKIKDEGLDTPSEFEIETALAFMIFKDAGVDYAVVEVGMGGKQDATNVITPIISIISHIAMDHMKFLGDTLEKIAYEKAGIIKENIPVVISPEEIEAKKVIYEVAREKNAKVISVNTGNVKIEKTSLEGQEFSTDFYKNLKISILGEHQIVNALTALTAIDVLREEKLLKIDDCSIYEGLLKTRWKGRFEIINKNPLVIIDGAHNEDGWINFRKTCDTYLKDMKKTLVIGVLADKDYNSAMDILIPIANHVITVTPESERALSGEELSREIEKRGIKAENSSISESLDVALKFKDEAVLYVGSLYMIGIARTMLRKRFKNDY